MRRIQRQSLPDAAQNYLDRRQQSTNLQHADGTLDVERRWNDARQTQPIKATSDSVLSTLRRMAGKSVRCMYCSDSLGTDIEHFRPKTSYPTHAFCWPNMLLCCSRCGRLKGAPFPLDQAGQPLFIDPSLDDPWAHLNFLPETGALTMREWLEADNAVQCSKKGSLTAEVLLSDEAIHDGFLRTYRHLCRRVREFMTCPTSAEHLLHTLSEEDTRGLLPWCFGRIGRTYPPFADLREQHAEVWLTCETWLRPAP